MSSHPYAILDDILFWTSHLSCAECLPCSCLRPPPSPALLSQEGELDTLLVGSSWDEADDGPSHVQKGFRAERRPVDKMNVGARLNSLFSGADSMARRGVPARATSGGLALPYAEEGGLGKGGSPISSFEADPDATSLKTPMVDAMAKFGGDMWEPDVTMEELQREEVDQAERERAGRSTTGGTFSLKEARTEHVEQVDEEGDVEAFGDFAEATPLHGATSNAGDGNDEDHGSKG